MTNKQVVSRLRQLGHEVEVYIRKDGSLRITKLDGVKYSSKFSEGVKAARQMLFDQLGEQGKTEAARYEAVKAQRRAAQASRRSKVTLRSQSKQFQENFKRLQREVRKANKRLAKQGKKASLSVSWENVRKGAEKMGIPFDKQLNRLFDYFLAVANLIAPPQLVEELEYKLMMWAPQHREFYKFVSFIQAGDNRKRLDIYETKATLEWAYGIVQGIRQSETDEERYNKFTTSLH